MRWAVVLTIGLLLIGSAYGQRGIRWSLKVEEGFRYAQKVHKPVMLYVRGRSERDDDFEDFERDHRKAFADPRVVALAKNFVTLQMSRSRYRDLLQRWNLSPRTTLEVVFATPDGEFIDVMSPSAVANADALAAKMSRVLRAFYADVYQKQIRPVLTDADSEPAALRRALETVRSVRIRTADGDVLALAKRENLDAGVRSAAYETLATLATTAGVQYLFERALAGDKQAEQALGKAPPPAAEYLVQFIGQSDAQKHLLAYRLAARIVRLSRPKNERFWSGPLQRVKDAEIKRIREAIRKSVRRWKQDHDE